jgi:hypothetical protein
MHYRPSSMRTGRSKADETMPYTNVEVEGMLEAELTMIEVELESKEQDLKNLVIKLYLSRVY